MYPAVSAIVPCYNVASYVGDCLDSLLAQGETIAEIICVDDCSTDDTLKQLEAYARRHPSKITVLHNEKNSGASYSRNRALQEAKGEYIQFLDADDLLEKGKIAHQLELLKSRPAFIAGAYTRRYEDGRRESFRVEGDDTWLALMRTRLGCTCSNLWKKEAVQEAGGFDDKLPSSQEYNLMFRLLKNGAQPVTDNEDLTTVRDRAQGSISSANPGPKWERYVCLRADIIAHLESSGGMTPARKQAAMQILFDAVRTWYRYDARAAAAFYDQHFPPGFQPVVSAATSAIYLRFFRLFGFRGAERVRRLTGR